MEHSLLYVALLPLPLVAPAYFLAKAARTRRRRLRSTLDSSLIELQRLAPSLFDVAPTEAFREAPGAAAGVVVTELPSGVQAVGERDGLRVTARVEYRLSSNWWGHGAASDPQARWNGLLHGDAWLSVPLANPATRFALHSTSMAAREMDVPAAGLGTLGDFEFRKIWHSTGDLELDAPSRAALLALQFARPNTDFKLHTADRALTIQWAATPTTSADWANWRETVHRAFEAALRLRATPAPTTP